MKESELAKAALGEHIYENYVEAKEALNGMIIELKYMIGKLRTI
ncbi:hypothetical protein [Clostridium butyricum]